MRPLHSYRALPAEDPLRGNMVPVHDPSIARGEDGTWMVFDTDVPFLQSEHFLEQRCSNDLLLWHGCGYVFNDLPPWVRASFPEVSGLWAPDISYFHGLFHLYYAVSTLGSQHSAIGLATTPSLNPRDPRYGWTDRGEVLRSARGADFNAIDANVFTEAPGSEGQQSGAKTSEGRVWLNYGSFWGGIFQQELDPQTGRLLPGGRRYHLAEQPSNRTGALEGAAMIRHGDWYYLFASVGLCCEIPVERDTYQEIVGRAKILHGPFVAKDGTPLLKGGGSVLLTGDEHWIGPGGGSLWTSADGANTLMTFHALHRRENGALDLWVERVGWKDGWPVLMAVK